MNPKKCKVIHTPTLFAQSFTADGRVPTMKHWKCKKCNRVWSEEVCSSKN